MDPQDGQDTKTDIRDVRIRGSRLLLRALQPGEIEAGVGIGLREDAGGKGTDAKRSRCLRTGSAH
jgi:hypothetical protein